MQRAAEAGARRTREIYQAAGCEAQCGGCTGTVLCLLRKLLAADEAPNLAVTASD